MNALFGEPLSRQELIPAGLAAEATVSGFHADNIAPALTGGFVLIRCACDLDRGDCVAVESQFLYKVSCCCTCKHKRSRANCLC